MVWEVHARSTAWTLSGTDIPISFGDHAETADDAGAMKMNGHASSGNCLVRGTIAAAVRDGANQIVRLFDVCTGSVRKEWKVEGRVRSLAFWRGKPSSDATDMTQALGIVALTKDAEMLLLRVTEGGQVVRSGTKAKVAQKSNRLLGPSLMFTPVTTWQPEGEDAEGADGVPDQPQMQISTDGTSELFAEHSIHLLPVRDIFDAFMKLSLAPSAAPEPLALQHDQQDADEDTTSSTSVLGNSHADALSRELQQYLTSTELVSSTVPAQRLGSGGDSAAQMGDFFCKLVTDHTAAVAPRRGRTPHRRPRAGSLAASPDRTGLAPSPTRSLSASPTNLDVVALTPERLKADKLEQAAATTSKKSKRKNRKSAAAADGDGAAEEATAMNGDVEHDDAVAETPAAGKKRSTRTPRTRTKPKFFDESDGEGDHDNKPTQRESEPQKAASVRKRRPKSAAASN